MSPQRPNEEAGRGGAESDRIEAICDRFEGAWRGGRPPAIEEYLAELPDVAGPRARQVLLLELVLIDLERRWRDAYSRSRGDSSVPIGPAGQQPADGLPERPLLEDYAKRFEDLGPADRLPDEAIAAEYRVRHRWGGQPGREEYLRRFPGRRHELPRVLAEAGVAAGQDVPDGTPAGAGAASPSMGTGELGEYKLLEKLGEGGMGTVYKALHTRLDRIVAVKVLRGDRSWDEQAAARFDREMRAVGRVDHPNVVRAMDARHIGATRLLVTEYVEGLDLGELVRRCGPLGVADACELVRQAALGLLAAHEHGLVHRDVKPTNLMLNRQGQVKLLDLGLARFQAEQWAGGGVTSTGQAMGTLAYMAPEQLLDSSAVDIRADIYGLGCTFYELLAGQTPLAALAGGSTLQRMIASLHQPAPPISQFRPDVPDQLDWVLERMLARDPAERFATPAEVIDAVGPLAVGSNLAGLLARAEGRSSSAAAVPPVEAGTARRASSQGTQAPRTGPASRPVPVPVAPAPPSRRGVRKHLAIGFAVGVATASLLLLVLPALLRQRPAEVPPGGSILELDWPPHERLGARLHLDGEPVPFSPDGVVAIHCRPGEHRIAVRRPGYRTFQQVVEARPGQCELISPTWRPAPGEPIIVRADGRGDFQSIVEAVEAAPAEAVIEIQGTGPYREYVAIPGHKEGIVLRGGGDTWPVIGSLGDGKGPRGPVVWVEAPGMRLERVILVRASPVEPGSHCLVVRGQGFRMTDTILFADVGAGAFCMQPGADAEVQRCWIAGNIRIDGPVRFTNCLLLGAELDARSGCRLRACTVPGLVRLLEGDSDLRDCIIGQIQTEGDAPVHRIEHCNVLRGEVPRGSEGCFSADPQFRDPTGLDFRLRPTSPCGGKASDGEDMGCRYVPQMLTVVQRALDRERRAGK